MNCCLRKDCFYIYSGADFTNQTHTVTIPATRRGTFELSKELFGVIDDNLNEFEQSFALVAHLGDDVPDRFVCFQRQVGDQECLGRMGATEIRITDNDRKWIWHERHTP